MLPTQPMHAVSPGPRRLDGWCGLYHEQQTIHDAHLSMAGALARCFVREIHGARGGGVVMVESTFQRGLRNGHYQIHPSIASYHVDPIPGKRRIDGLTLATQLQSVELTAVGLGMALTNSTRRDAVASVELAFLNEFRTSIRKRDQAEWIALAPERERQLHKQGGQESWNHQTTLPYDAWRSQRVTMAGGAGVLPPAALPPPAITVATPSTVVAPVPLHTLTTMLRRAPETAHPLTSNRSASSSSTPANFL